MKPVYFCLILLIWAVYMLYDVYKTKKSVEPDNAVKRANLDILTEQQENIKKRLEEVK